MHGLLPLSLKLLMAENEVMKFHDCLFPLNICLKSLTLRISKRAYRK